MEIVDKGLKKPRKNEMDGKRILLRLAVLVVTSSAPIATLAGEAKETEVVNTGLTTRISVDSNGGQGNYGSAYPSISADGRYVAFASYASNLVSGDNDTVSDVFVHDQQNGQTIRISIASGGTEGNFNSTSPSISANGRYVAFV